MIHYALATFVALFVTVNPIKGATVFAVLSEDATPADRRRMATRATLIASVLLLIFALFGDDLLRIIGVSLAGVRVGGGILLLLLAIDIVFDRPIAPPAAADGTSKRPDLSVFPLATPIIVGPGAITAVVVKSSEANNHLLPTFLLFVALAVVMLLTWAAMLAVGFMQRWLGDTGMNVITRILGILLAALAAELVLTGLRESGVFK